MKPYYQDEAVTIYHGDCREILPSLPKVDLVLTDRQNSAPSMLYSEHENQSEGRMEAQGGRTKMAATKARNRMAVSGAELVSSSDRGLLCGISNGNDKGVQAAWDWQSGERSSGEAERKVQGRIAEYDVSLNDSERQVFALSDHGESSHSPQELQPSGQSSRESSSVVQSVSHPTSQNRVVEASKVLCLTDPPYGIGKDGQKPSTGTHGGRKAYEFRGWDKCRPSAEIFRLIIAASDSQIICGGNYFADLLPATSGWIVWDKGQRINQSDGELAWTSFGGALRIWTMNRVELLLDGACHPTQKPLRLIQRCIVYADKQGDLAGCLILDPFMGSGTTLRAAKDLGRKAIGIEIEERYCEIAAKRMSQSVLDFTHPDSAGRGDSEPTQEGFFASLS